MRRKSNERRFLTQSAWGKYCSLWVTSTMVRLSSRSIFRIPSCIRWSLRWISRAEKGSSCHDDNGSAFGATTYGIQGNSQVLIPVNSGRSTETQKRSHQIKTVLRNGFLNLQNTKTWTVFLQKALSNTSCVNFLWGFLGPAALPRCAHGPCSWRTQLLSGSRQRPSRTTHIFLFPLNITAFSCFCWFWCGLFVWLVFWGAFLFCFY